MSEHKESQKISGDTLIRSLLDKINPADYKRTATRMRVAATIADQMEAHGLSKSALAKKMDVPPSVITKWLSGTHNFTIDTLSDISTILNLPISELFIKPEDPTL